MSDKTTLLFANILSKVPCCWRVIKSQRNPKSLKFLSLTILFLDIQLRYKTKVGTMYYLLLFCFFPGQSTSYKRAWTQKLQIKLNRLEVESSITLFKSEINWRVNHTPLPPPVHIISPKISSQHFEIAILISIVKSPGNYIFWNAIPPPYTTQGKSCK